MSSFAGKVAVVTGGNSGMGLATAQEFARRGAKVVISGRDEKTLAAAAEKIAGETLAVRADIARLADIDRLFAETKARFGAIDVLFANAGVGRFFSLEEATEEFYDEIMDINLKGTFFTLQKALPLLNDGGAIVVNTSVASKKGFGNFSVYSASKAGLRSLVRSSAGELAPRNIRVNAVAPGPIDTPIFTRLDMTPQAAQEAKEGFATAVPLRRMGTPEEVALAVAFLASSDASYITGVELNVDGGMGQI